ncbi:glycerol kinase GlpK [Paenibacillus sp. FSL R10-2734]|uniref:glycerol kinase GlpK n=1 Tax=Paenibacillus sp. FSL R10-2734 TaxID=2954691 RepID=UPI0030DD87D2
MNPERYILAIDQSTSGTKALVVDRSGNVIARSSKEHKQYYPQPGWVEHDPLEIYENVIATALSCMEKAGIASGDIATLTLTNQRETALIWDRVTGLPIHNAIVWQCQRTAQICVQYQESKYEQLVTNKTGLMLDPYFSATKLQWLLDHVDGARDLAAEGRLLAGTIDSWIIWKLSGGIVHATDYTNASRTSLFNIHTLQWDEELCSLFHVPSSLLPMVKPSDTIFGYTKDPSIFDVEIPISGIIGDSQGALFGQMCHQPGMAKATYGTGTSVMMNIGEKPMTCGEGLVTTIAWGANGTVTYALESVLRTTGDSIKWIRDNLGLFTTFDEMQALLKSIPSNEGVYLVPAFVGMGAPYWDPFARAAIMGMNRSTGRGHIIRAALESIAYQVKDSVMFLQEKSGIPLSELRADGGASANDWLMQFQADLLDHPLTRSTCAELSAMGSVYLGGLATDFWSDLDLADLASSSNLYESFTPNMSEAIRQQLYSGWKDAVLTVVHTKDTASIEVV